MLYQGFLHLACALLLLRTLLGYHLHEEPLTAADLCTANSQQANIYIYSNLTTCNLTLTRDRIAKLPLIATPRQAPHTEAVLYEHLVADDRDYYVAAYIPEINRVLVYIVPRDKRGPYWRSLNVATLNRQPRYGLATRRDLNWQPCHYKCVALNAPDTG